MNVRPLVVAAFFALGGGLFGCRHPALGAVPSPHEPAGDYDPPAEEGYFRAEPPATARALRISVSDLEALELATTLGRVRARDDGAIDEDIAELGGNHFLAIGTDGGAASPKPEATSVCGRYDGPGRVPCGPWPRRWSDHDGEAKRPAERGTFLVLRVAPERWASLPIALQPQRRSPR